MQASGSYSSTSCFIYYLAKLEYVQGGRRAGHRRPDQARDGDRPGPRCNGARPRSYFWQKLSFDSCKVGQVAHVVGCIGAGLRSSALKVLILPSFSKLGFQAYPCGAKLQGVRCIAASDMASVEASVQGVPLLPADGDVKVIHL